MSPAKIYDLVFESLNWAEVTLLHEKTKIYDCNNVVKISKVKSSIKMLPPHIN